MDRLDVAILQEMSRGSLFWWGGPEPRVSSDLLARRVGTAGSTVRARLRRWEEAGFLRGSEVLPSPRLFGGALATGTLAVDDRAGKAETLHALRRIPNIAALVDHAGPSLAFALVAASSAEIDAAFLALARLPRVREVVRGVTPSFPASAPSMSKLDWRILDALRRQPHARVAGLVEDLGISARTFTRRYQRLVDERAMLVWLRLDFAKLPGVVTSFRVCGSGTSTRSLADRIMRAFPDAIAMRGPHASGAADRLDVVLGRPCVPAMEDAFLSLLAMPGVVDVVATHLRGIEILPSWFDRQRPLAMAPGPALALAPMAG